MITVAAARQILDLPIGLKLMPQFWRPSFFVFGNVGCLMMAVSGR